MPRHLLTLPLLAASLLLAACVTTEEDKKALQAGFASYSARNFDSAEAAANTFLTKNPTSENVDEAYYLRGLARLSSGGAGNRALAADDLKQSIAKSQRPDLKAKAYRILGDLYFDDSRFADALPHYQQALTLPKPATAHLNYRIGACLQAQGEWARARPYFQTVAADTSDPALAARAAGRMDLTSYSLQFGAFAEGPRAAKSLADLKAAGVTATIVSEMREGKLLYILRSGNYRTWAEADAARDPLQARGLLVTIIP